LDPPTSSGQPFYLMMGLHLTNIQQVAVQLLSLFVIEHQTVKDHRLVALQHFQSLLSCSIGEDITSTRLY